VMISIISERYNIHPQTLRLYEREGLIKPERTGGNTRLYGPKQIRQLETILTLTRDLGVNLAGVEVFLRMQLEMEKMEMDADRILDAIRRIVLDRRIGLERENALVKSAPRHLAKIKRS
jgi:MerR family transcriptional regulator, heat shock protein HspR